MYKQYKKEQKQIVQGGKVQTEDKASNQDNSTKQAPKTKGITHTKTETRKNHPLAKETQPATRPTPTHTLA
jgi:hypothetical protein